MIPRAHTGGRTSNISDDEMMDGFAGDDWYVSKKDHHRRKILAILYLARNEIMDTINQRHKKDVWPQFVRVKWQKPVYADKFLSDVNNWIDIQHILKSMWRKYRSEENHIQFECFLDEATKIYKR